MKKRGAIISIILIIAMAILGGCSSDENVIQPETTAEPVEKEAFNYSEAFDNNGYWKDVKAADYVNLSEYMGISVPSEVHQISDEAVQTEMNSIISTYTSEKQIKDRAVQNGDTVNIDYVGSVDGVEFEGGSTNGNGTKVTIGVTNYIDDFLEQLIGHTPGESFDIEVTFPDEYANEALEGKDAVFAITINYISEVVEPSLTDDFIRENLSSRFGWNNIGEMEVAVKKEMQKLAIGGYVQDYIIENSTVTSIPDAVLNYQKTSLIDYYQVQADNNYMKLEEFLSTNMGLSSIDELLESSKKDIEATSNYYLIVQAVAEKNGITVSDEDLAAYFIDYMGIEDYSEYQEFYGLPYLKVTVLHKSVLDYLVENSVLA